MGHATQLFGIRSDAALHAANLQPNAVYTFQAHSVHMDAGYHNTQFYRLGAAGQPPIMLAGQLSGCSFVMRPVANQAGDADVAHVKPVDMTGRTLRDNVTITYQDAQGEIGPGC